MYWFNPKTRTSERRIAPSTDDEAIEVLTGDPLSAALVTEYAELRNSGMNIEQALIFVGHEFRLRQTEHTSPKTFRARAIGYDRFVGTGPSRRR